MTKFSFQDCPATELGKPARDDVARVKRGNIAVAVGCFGLVAACGILFGILPRYRAANPQPQEMRAISTPSELIQRLPSSYARNRVEVITPPKMAEEPQPVMTEEQKLWQETRLKKLRQALVARESGIFFARSSGEGNRLNDSERKNALPLDTRTDLVENKGTLNPRENDSRQDEKNEFLERERKQDISLGHGLASPLTPYGVLAGTVVPALLLSAINSDLPGRILAQVSQDVWDTKSGSYLIIPQGAKLIGEYDSRISYGQERVLVVWTRIIFPNGKSISLEGMPGVDLIGQAGMSDQVNNHFARLLRGVLLGSVLGATVQMAEGQRSYSPSFAELAAQGMAQNMNEAGQQITRKNLNVQPTIEIRPGSRFNVFVTKDMFLELYKP